MQTMKIWDLAFILCVGCGQGAPEITPRSFKVVSLNIATGAGYVTPWHRDIQAAFLEGLGDLDFVAMQEVLYTDEIGDTASLSLGKLASRGVVLFGAAHESETYRYGNSLWVSERHTVLSTRTVVYPYDGSEQYRSALVVDVKLQDGRVITLVSTHLSCWGNLEYLRKVQLETIAAQHADVVIGDFNMSPQAVGSALAPLKNSVGETIDQIWAADSVGSVVPTDVTDHGRAIISTVN